jgi:hypothetical protein
MGGLSSAYIVAKLGVINGSQQLTVNSRTLLELSWEMWLLDYAGCGGKVELIPQELKPFYFCANLGTDLAVL